MAKHLRPHDSDLIEILDPKHCRAICEEIGERVRQSLARDTSPIPTRLRRLVDRIAELEGEASLIIPDCGEKPPCRARPERRPKFWRFG